LLSASWKTSRKYNARLNQEKEAAEKLRSLQDKNTEQKQKSREEAKLMKHEVLEIGEKGKATVTKDNLCQEELKHAEDLFADGNSRLC
jgi:hypothetical protein